MIEFLEQARHVVAVLVVVTLPPAILYWCLIHPFAKLWRRLGGIVSFTLVGGICLAFCVWIYQYREPLLAIRYPFSWWLAVPGVLLYALAIRIEIQCRRHLKLRILVGGPEVGKNPGKLLKEGIYARTRNPRYLDLLLGLAGWSLVLNYRTVYVMTLAMVPAIYLVILLEERELRERFGEEYERYLEEVPRLIPRFS